MGVLNCSSNCILARNRHRARDTRRTREYSLQERSVRVQDQAERRFYNNSPWCIPIFYHPHCTRLFVGTRRQPLAAICRCVQQVDTTHGTDAPAQRHCCKISSTPFERMGFAPRLLVAKTKSALPVTGTNQTTPFCLLSHLHGLPFPLPRSTCLHSYSRAFSGPDIHCPLLCSFLIQLSDRRSYGPASLHPEKALPSSPFLALTSPLSEARHPLSRTHTPPTPGYTRGPREDHLLP